MTDKINRQHREQEIRRDWCGFGRHTAYGTCTTDGILCAVFGTDKIIEAVIVPFVGIVLQLFQIFHLCAAGSAFEFGINPQMIFLVQPTVPDDIIVGFHVHHLVNVSFCQNILILHNLFLQCKSICFLRFMGFDKLVEITEKFFFRDNGFWLGLIERVIQNGRVNSFVLPIA